jgi:hypothetical protein
MDLCLHLSSESLVTYVTHRRTYYFAYSCLLIVNPDLEWKRQILWWYLGRSLLQKGYVEKPSCYWEVNSMINMVLALIILNSYLPNITMLIFGNGNHSFIYYPTWLPSTLASVKINTLEILKLSSKYSWIVLSSFSRWLISKSRIFSDRHDIIKIFFK